MTKCKICKTEFIKTRPLQAVCGLACAMKTATIKAAVKRIKAEQQDKRETKVKLAKLEGKPELTQKAQKAFNTYVRMRDYGLKCISCDNPIAWDDGKTGGVVDCGHYLSVGARVNLRFVEDNAAAQCKKCNNFLSGNAVNYRIGLIKRIGLERVEALECDHKLNHYTKADLRAIEATYKAKFKALCTKHLNLNN